MTLVNRVLLGFAVGALLTLLVTPVSRPYLMGLVTGPSARTLSSFESTTKRLKPPTTVREAAHWTVMAAQKISDGPPFTAKEFSSLLSVVTEAAKKDATNAFWPQMEAVVEERQGHSKAARVSWIAGSRRTHWNDYQSDELNDDYEQLVLATHERQGWQLAYRYRKRSPAAARLIEKFARAVVATTDLATPESLTLRYATVANGALLREGSKNVAIGQIGALIVEIGAYPADLARRPNPRRLILGENELFNSLNRISQPDWANYVQQQFRGNEAWQAFSTSDIADEKARDLGFLTLILAVLPSAVFFVGLVGLVVWGFGTLCHRRFQGKSFGWIFPVGCAIILSLIVYLLTSFITAAVAAALCGLFLSVSPSKQRSARSPNFGPTFSFTIGMLAMASGLCLGAFLVWGSGPAVSLLPYLSVSGEYFGGSPLFIGLAVLFFSMVFLVTPFWGLAQHIPTPFVFSTGMRRFGATLSVTALVLTVISSPVVIYADQQTSKTLKALLLNEPVYYDLKYGPGS